MILFQSLIYPSLHYTQHDSSPGLGIDFLIYFTLIMICKHSQLLSSCSAEADFPESKKRGQKTILGLFITRSRLIRKSVCPALLQSDYLCYFDYLF